MEEYYFQNMKIQGGWSKPKIQELVMVRTIILPYTILAWVYGIALWVVRYNILGRDYTPEDRVYLTRRALDIPA